MRKCYRVWMYNIVDKMIITCAACDKAILDRFVVNVLDRSWHSGCARCFDCRTILIDKCFTRENKLFCKNDFFRRFGTKCAGCAQRILPQEMVRKARDKVFHLNCFTCTICRRQLSTGEELYVLDDTKFICKDDYIQVKQDSIFSNDEEDDEDDLFDSGSNSHPHAGMSPGNPASTSSLVTPLENIPSLACPTDTDVRTPVTSSADNSNLDKDNGNESEGSVDADGESREPGRESPEDSSVGGSKRRGPRTTIKAKQLEILKTAFSQTPKPTRHIRDQLAKETGLPMRVIQVWFQNKRSKERRLKQLTSMGRGPFFGSSRKIRGFPMNFNPSIEDGQNPSFPYFADAKFNEFGYGPGGGPSQGFHDFFPGPQSHFQTSGGPMNQSNGIPDFVGPTGLQSNQMENQSLNPSGPPGNFTGQGVDMITQHRSSPDYMPSGAFLDKFI